MTSLFPRPSRFPMTAISHPLLPIPSLDSTAVADAIDGTGWSVRYHESPDYKASLMILPDEDGNLSTFVISEVETCFRLQECRDDALHGLGEFATLEDVIIRLCRALKDQIGPRRGTDAGRASR
jgi:hypothetical protein